MQHQLKVNYQYFLLFFRYGLALRYSRFSTHAWHGMVNRLGLQMGDISLPCQALTLAGDIFYLVSKDWDDIATHIDEYNNVSSVHEKILTLLDHILPAQG